MRAYTNWNLRQKRKERIEKESTIAFEIDESSVEFQTLFIGEYFHRSAINYRAHNQFCSRRITLVHVDTLKSVEMLQVKSIIGLNAPIFALDCIRFCNVNYFSFLSFNLNHYS